MALDLCAGVLDVRLESAGIPALLLADASSSAEFVISAPRALEAEFPVLLPNHQRRSKWEFPQIGDPNRNLNSRILILGTPK